MKIKYGIFFSLYICFGIILFSLSSFSLSINDTNNNELYQLTYYLSIDTPAKIIDLPDSSLRVETVDIKAINGRSILSKTINQKTSLAQLNKFNNYAYILKTSTSKNVNVKFSNVLLIILVLDVLICGGIFIIRKACLLIYHNVNKLSLKVLRVSLIVFFSILYLLGTLYNSDVRNLTSNSNSLIYMSYYLNNSNIPSQVSVFDNGNLLYVDDLLIQHITPKMIDKKCDGSTGLCYVPYVSSFGLQAVLFKYIGKLCGIQSIVHYTYMCEVLEIIFLAIVLSEILIVFKKVFGQEVFITLLVGLSFTYVLAKFAPSAYWNIWIMLLPFLLSTKYMLDKSSFLYQNDRFLVSALGGVLLIKMLLGYEWLSSLVLSSMVPLIWDGESIKIKNVFGLLCKIIVTTLIIFSLSLFLWRVQLGSDGFYSAFTSDIVRWISVLYSKSPPSGAEIYNQAVNASLLTVIWRVFTQPNFFLFFGFYFLLIVYLAIICYYRRLNSNVINSIAKLILISTVAPLSWFVLAKSHSYVHAYLNYVLWLVPSGIYIYVLVGVIYYERNKLKHHIQLKDYK